MEYDEEIIDEEMMKDLYDRKMVVIGFAKRQHKNTVKFLSNLESTYPELITPILFSGGEGEIHFTWNGEYVSSKFFDDNTQIKELNISIQRFKSFLEQVRDFAMLINDNGNNDLNL